MMSLKVNFCCRVRVNVLDKVTRSDSGMHFVGKMMEPYLKCNHIVYLVLLINFVPKRDHSLSGIVRNA